MAATKAEKKPLSAPLQNELAAIRAKILELSRKHHVSVAELVASNQIFTENELRLGLPEDPPAATTLASNEYSLHRPPARTSDAQYSLPRPSSMTADPSEGSSVSQRGSPSAASHMNISLRQHGVERQPELDSSLSVVEIEEFKRTVSLPHVGEQLISHWNVPHGYHFGIEMETIIYKRSDELLTDNQVKAIRDVTPQLNSALGKGFNFVFFDYDSSKTDRLYNKWKVTTDLSIKSEDGRPIFGLEFISPKLLGCLGLRKVEQACRALVGIGCCTNNTTALHVHVSAENTTNDEIRRYCQYSVTFEHVIDNFMTVPRRADYSRYCRSNLRSISVIRNVRDAVEALEKLDLSSSINPLVQLMCPRLSNVKNAGRNHKINLLLLQDTVQRTPGRRVECRQHQGTCDAEEVGAWTSLLITWFHKTTKMPKPDGQLGTLDRFWEIIGDPQLKAFFMVKMQTLPTNVDFTYDSRELYQYEDVNSGSETPLASSVAPTLPVAPPPPLPRSQRPNAPVFVESSETSTPSPEQRPHHHHPAPPQSTPEAKRPSSLKFSVEETSPVVNVVKATPLSEGSPLGDTTESKKETLSGGRHPTILDNSVKTVDESMSFSARRLTSIDSSINFLALNSQYSAQQAADSTPLTKRKNIAKKLGGSTSFALPASITAEVEIYDPSSSWDANGQDIIAATQREFPEEQFTLIAQESPSTDADAWKVTATQPMVPHLVRSLRGLRFVSPALSQSKQFSILDHLVEESFLGTDLSVIMYHVSVAALSDEQVCRVIECFLLFEDALDSLLNNTNEGDSPVFAIMEKVRPTQRSPSGMIDKIRQLHHSGGMTALAEALNPPQKLAKKDRSFKLQLRGVVPFPPGNPNRKLIYRSTYKPGGVAQFEAGLVACIVEYSKGLTGSETKMLAQHVELFGEVNSATLLDKAVKVGAIKNFFLKLE